MSRELSPESRKSLDAFVRKIADQHELGEEVHEELVGHVEDRVLGLLVEDESLSERKALDQVQAHFGDAVELKELLRGVHADASTLSFARRFLCIATHTMLIYAGIGVLMHMFSIGVIYVIPVSLQSNANTIANMLLMGPFGVFLLWRRVQVWKNSQSSVRPHWIFRRSLQQLQYCLVLSLSLYWLVPGSRPLLILQGGQINSYDVFEQYVAVRLGIVSFVCMCLVWLRWFDKSPFSIKRMAAAGGSWVLFLFGVSMLPPRAILHFRISALDAELVPSGWKFFTTELPGTNLLASWYYPSPFDWTLVSVLRGFQDFNAVYALAALLIYVVVVRRFPLRPQM